MFVKKLLILEILSCVFCIYCNGDILSKFHQHDYKTKDLRSELAYINKDYMHAINLIGRKFNRTTITFNFTLWPKIDLQNKVEVVVQSYKRASNEYRLFPMRFQINMCKTFESNVIGLRNINRFGNFTTCYWKKDTLYYANNVFLDENELPPFIPFGEYKTQADLMFGKIKMATFYTYVEIYSGKL